MNLISLTEADLGLLGQRLAHLKKFDFSSMNALSASITNNSQTDSNIYKISPVLSLGIGYIDGKHGVMMFGNGHSLSEIFGTRRVFGR